MLTTAAVLAVTFMVCGLVQIGFVGRFHWFSGRHSPDIAPTWTWTPKTAVILCVRGYDSCLDACLHGLLNQDYRDYTVNVVVDSVVDPAWPAMLKWQTSVGEERLRISPLRDRRKTCSLKCSSLVQAMNDLMPDEEVVALIDADVVPTPTWLGELVKPLHDPSVGLSTGNRWFEPKAGMWGTNVRSCWNAGAVVQMSNFEIPWGGSLAMRRADIEPQRVIDHWSRSFNDDVILSELFSQAGKRLHRIPKLLMINREDIPLPRLTGWVVRQCVHFRHYHRSWRHIGIFNLVIALLTLIHLVMPPILLACGQSGAASYLIAGLVGYYLNQVCLCAWVEFIAQRVLRQQHQTVTRLGWRLLWVFPVTHVVYCVSFVMALFRRRLQWRGVWYRIHAPLRVEVLHDVPIEGATPAQSLSIL